MKLLRYHIYASLWIRVLTHGRKTGQTPQEEIKRQATKFVENNVPQTQLGTVYVRDQTREKLSPARSSQYGSSLCLLYFRSQTRKGNDADWIACIAAMAANEALVIGVDGDVTRSTYSGVIS